MIFYWPETQPWGDPLQPRQRKYFRLPSGGTLAAEAWDCDQLRVVEIISTDLADYMNSVIQPGSILSLKPQVQSEASISAGGGSDASIDSGSFNKNSTI